MADRVIIDAPPATVAQVRQTLECFRNRPSVVLEVFVLDVSTNVVDRVNAWLDSVRIGGGYMARSARSALVGAMGGAGADLKSLPSVAGPTWDADVRGLFDLLEVNRSARVELRQQAQILSGSQTRFDSGKVQDPSKYSSGGPQAPRTGGGAGARAVNRYKIEVVCPAQAPEESAEGSFRVMPTEEAPKEGEPSAIARGVEGLHQRIEAIRTRREPDPEPSNLLEYVERNAGRFERPPARTAFGTDAIVGGRAWDIETAVAWARARRWGNGSPAALLDATPLRGSIPWLEVEARTPFPPFQIEENTLRDLIFIREPTAGSEDLRL